MSSGKFIKEPDLYVKAILCIREANILRVDKSCPIYVGILFIYWGNVCSTMQIVVKNTVT